MNNLEIFVEYKNEETILKCSGRLDANRAGYLNEYIDKLVREGHYLIALDMTGIEYLSSAGIRSLITQSKNLQTVSGCFYISAMSDNVHEVLKLVGMAEMLSKHDHKVGTKTKPEHPHRSFNAHGFSFSDAPLNEKASMEITLYGKPEKVMHSDFKVEDARLFQAEEQIFSIGLGAIGESYEECRERFGEYLVAGKNMAYIPGDGSQKPDYIVSSGLLIGKLTELYGMHFKGEFSHILHFERTDAINGIGVSQLTENISQLTGYDHYVLVMIAESDGLTGTSLNVSPVDGARIFTYPEVIEAVRFTTEPVYEKMQTLSIGYITTKGEDTSTPFVRSLTPGSSTKGHIHTAVFPYIPINKNSIDLYETIDVMFNTSLIDLLHLTNDSREIKGIGESRFIQGFCWVAPVHSIQNV
jgi:anti-anti-sigma factor